MTKSKNIHTSHSTCVELCAGAGGQSLGLEQAGFEHLMLVDNDESCCATLRYNRPEWNVVSGDLLTMDPMLKISRPVDLLAGGLPCPPFSVAGKKLGQHDERNLFPAALDIVEAIKPRAVMIENVKGFLDPGFKEYRESIRARFVESGYSVEWRLLNASDYGVPQLRPRVVIVALCGGISASFNWPEPLKQEPRTVGETLSDLMAAGGWEHAQEWAEKANTIAPTVVGGSKKHGGPDLGPTRAKKAWAALSVNGHSIAEAPPEPGFDGMPRLTVRMVARLQGFPDDWEFVGKKTAAYRQVGNAFPPPVAHAVASQIAACLRSRKQIKEAS